MVYTIIYVFFCGLLEIVVLGSLFRIVVRLCVFLFKILSTELMTCNLSFSFPTISYLIYSLVSSSRFVTN